MIHRSQEEINDRNNSIRQNQHNRNVRRINNNNISHLNRNNSSHNYQNNKNNNFFDRNRILMNSPFSSIQTSFICTVIHDSFTHNFHDFFGGDFLFGEPTFIYFFL